MDDRPKETSYKIIELQAQLYFAQAMNDFDNEAHKDAIYYMIGLLKKEIVSLENKHKDSAFFLNAIKKSIPKKKQT